MTVSDGYYWGYRKGSPQPDIILVRNGRAYEFGTELSEDLWEMKWRVGEKIEPPTYT
jgi:hypothetical protein